MTSRSPSCLPRAACWSCPSTLFHDPGYVRLSLTARSEAIAAALPVFDAVLNDVSPVLPCLNHLLRIRERLLVARRLPVADASGPRSSPALRTVPRFRDDSPVRRPALTAA